MERKDKKALVEEYVKRILFLVDDASEDFFENDDNKQKIEDILKKAKDIVHFSIDEESVIFLFEYGIDSERKVETYICELSKYIQNNLQDKEIKIYLIGIAESIHEKNILLRALHDYKSKICKDIKRFAKDTSTDVIFMPKMDSKPIELNVTRMNSLLFPEPTLKLNILEAEEKEKDEIKGYLFVVKLSELVAVYDRVGDELFSSNLRYGIEDKLSLENSMKATLIEEPNMFWFYNNGITIVTDSDNIGLKNASKIVLCESWKKRKLSFSVINGAQTISTASRIFGDNSIPEKELMEAKENARVLLRIIIAERKLVKRKITISLNRQKPIKTEDIAFQSQFVSAFNEYMSIREKNGADHLRIIKRGEEVYDNDTIELSVFAQLVYACFMNPTDARNKGPAKLYYDKKDEENLKETYFKRDFYTEDKDKEAVFKRYYQEVIWAYMLLRNYNKYLKKYKDKYDRSILANNKWSFISYVLGNMVGFFENAEEVDYSNFIGNYNMIINLEKYMDSFIEIAKSAYGKSYTSESSKTREFWEAIIKVEVPDLYKSLAIKCEESTEDITQTKTFEEILKDMGFSSEDGKEYEDKIDCPFASSVKVCINIDQKNFSIYSILHNPFLESEEVNKKAILFQELREGVIERLSNLCKLSPECNVLHEDDGEKVKLSYSDVPFEKDFIERFISAMCDCAESYEELNAVLV